VAPLRATMVFRSDPKLSGSSSRSGCSTASACCGAGSSDMFEAATASASSASGASTAMADLSKANMTNLVSGRAS
jgi:hypothetical protein